MKGVFLHISYYVISPGPFDLPNVFHIDQRQGIPLMTEIS